MLSPRTLPFVQVQSEALHPEHESAQEGKGFLQRVKDLEEKRRGSYSEVILDITLPMHSMHRTALESFLRGEGNAWSSEALQARLQMDGNHLRDLPEKLSEYLAMWTDDNDGDIFFYSAFACGRRGARPAEVVHSSPNFVGAKRFDIIGIVGQDPDGKIMTMWAMKVEAIMKICTYSIERGCVFGPIWTLQKDKHAFPWKGDSTYASLWANWQGRTVVSDMATISGVLNLLPDWEMAPNEDSKSGVVFKEPSSIEVL